MSDYSIKQGDTLPPVAVTLMQNDGTVVNLSGLVVDFQMRQRGVDDVVLTGAAEIVSALGGTVKYDWSMGETDTIGLFDAEFVVTFLDGQQTYPTDGSIEIEIKPNLTIDTGDDPEYAFTFATALDAREITGRDVSLEMLAMGQVVVEIFADLPATLVPTAISARDLYWLKIATVFQARWLEAHPDYLERLELTEGIHDGAQ